MFAHEVLYDLQNFNKKYKSNHPNFDIELKQNILKWIDVISNNHKFHIGDLNEILDQLKNIPTLDREIYKMPYPSIWLDFIINNTPSGLLVIERLEFLECHMFIKHMDINKFDSTGIIVFLKLTKNEKGKYDDFIGFMENTYRPNQEDVEFHIRRVDGILNLFVSLLNCKNIGTIDNNPSKTQIKKYRSKGKLPPFVYKTLHVKVFDKKKKEYVLNESISKHENRVHFCRAHFRTYTKEKPLFGHFVGTIWIQSHIRGKIEKGIVDKDYIIKTKRKNK